MAFRLKRKNGDIHRRQRKADSQPGNALQGHATPSIAPRTMRRGRFAEIEGAVVQGGGEIRPVVSLVDQRVCNMGPHRGGYDNTQ